MLKLSSMRGQQQVLVGHANSKKHKDILDHRQSFFQTKGNDNA